MPFQDVDEVSTVEARVPSRLERILRKIFIEDWNLKLLSLGITLLLWFVVTSQNTPINTHASAQLKFNRPDSLEISNDPPRTVDVLLTGSKHKLDELDRTSLIATVDISDQHEGERVLRLADRAQIAQLPQGVKIEGFQPSVISIRLEAVIDKEIPIEPRIEGTPAPGYEVYAVRPSKTTVSAHGPASNVNAIPKALTETVSVSGRKESFTEPNVALDISDPKVDLLNPVLSVDIEIGERRTETVFADVPVDADNNAKLLQHTATVTLAGPGTLMSQLKRTDIRVHLNGNASQPTLELPSVYQGKVILKSIKPEKFVASR
ncbi:MAG: hypothetical protein C5B55_04010 [Blastocatellia bacterium]|nr:MAG: hypothetical protein C5B55_04010 [Blastocatellia bacterium]